ncbi:MAG: PqqD family protein [Planctomycetes bacterium]|nr:PqqD family protein [Planctomycetota bacterium]
MGLLTGRRRKIRHLGQVGLDNPLDVVPQAEPDVEARPDSRDCLHLRRRFEPTGRLYRHVARLLRHRHEVRIALDERGTLFWRLMDGRRTLRMIAAAMAAALDGADEDEARRAVILFARLLMARHLVYLKVPMPAEDRRR